MKKLNYKQKIAYKYYCAYSALCGHQHDGIPGREQAELRVLREIMHMKYKQYDPDNSFDVSRTYDA